jgi:nitrite reductase/ring-hydroxylating ferredoxin subunit/uncharacterized membrane protein
MTTIQEMRQQFDSLIGEGEFQQVSADVSQYLREKLLEAGEETREAADILHGKHLGHPLHPVLTDLTIGGWTLGIFFDVLAFITGASWARKSANMLIGFGTLSAIPTALAGLADYSAIKKDAAGYAAAHGILNGVAFFCFAASVVARFKRNSVAAFFLALFGSGFSTLSAWLGGDMVYRHRVGIDHSQKAGLDDWAAVMTENELENNTLTSVEAGNQQILLYRNGDEIYAIGAVCSHAGGPLEEGSVNDTCVECPWHQSIFDMRDGQVVHGPSTFNQPRYSVRTRNGQIEIKPWTGEATSGQQDSASFSNGYKGEVANLEEA